MRHVAGIGQQVLPAVDLELDEALSGGTSRVFLGRQRGDRRVVLKLTPDRSVADGEAAGLRAWASNSHAVDLLDADAESGALLLEKLEPGTKLSDQIELPPLAEIAGLLTSLRIEDAAAQEGTDQLPTLAQRVDFLFALIGRRIDHPRVSALRVRCRRWSTNSPKTKAAGSTAWSRVTWYENGEVRWEPIWRLIGNGSFRKHSGCGCISPATLS